MNEAKKQRSSRGVLYALEIVELLELYNLPQRFWAEFFGVSPSTFNSWLRGINKVPLEKAEVILFLIQIAEKDPSVVRLVHKECWTNVHALLKKTLVVEAFTKDIGDNKLAVFLDRGRIRRVAEKLLLIHEDRRERF